MQRSLPSLHRGFWGVACSLLLNAGCGGDDAGGHGDASVSPDGGPAAEPVARVVLGDSERGAADGVGESARFQGITAMCRLSSTRVALSDTFAGTIRLLDLETSEVTTLAGSPDEPGVVDGPLEESRFAGPRGLGCLPGEAGLLVADDGALRHIDLAARTVTTVAGRPGAPGYEDGSAVRARFGYLIHAIAVAPDGRTAIFSDRSNDAIRAVDLETYEVRTVSGTDASWDGPGGLAFDPSDSSGSRVIVADTFGNRVRELDLVTGMTRDVASVEAPQGVVVHEGAVFSMGFGASVTRTVLASGESNVLTDEFGGTFSSPVVSGGSLIFAELERGSVRRLDLSTAEDVLVAGPELPSGYVDGPGDASRFEQITDMVASRDGAWVILADSGNSVLRRAQFSSATASTVDTLEVTGLVQPVGLALSADETMLAIADYGAGAVIVVQVDAAGSLSSPRVVAEGLDGPAGVAWSDDGALFVAEFDGARVVRVAADGAVTEQGTFNAPFGLAWSGDGLLVLDTDPGELLGIDLGGNTLTLSGGTATEQPMDGPLEDATWALPARAVSIEPRTWLVTDRVPGTVRLVDDGETFGVRTVVGSTVRGGGMAAGASAPLARAEVGNAVGVAVIEGAWLVATDTAVIRIEGDALASR